MTVLNITRFIRENTSLIKKKLEHGKMGKIWSINRLFAVTHKTDFFSIICFTAIINHAFKELTIMSMH